MNGHSTIQYPAIPLGNVFLHGGFEIQEDASGKTVRYVDLLGLAAAILHAVVTKPGRLSNTELVFLRRKLDLSQKQCANLLGVKEQTLSLWERNSYSLPVSTDALLRRICIEELSEKFPKRVAFPRTALLVRMASSTGEGRYECAFDQNRWDAKFLRQEESKTIDSMVFVGNLVLKEPSVNVGLRSGEASAIGRTYDVSTTQSFKGPKSKIRRVFGRIAGQTIEMDSSTRILDVRRGRITSTEGFIQ